MRERTEVNCVLTYETVRRLKTCDMELQVRSIQKNTRSIRVNPEFPVQYPEYPDISGSSGSKFRRFRFPRLQEMKLSLSRVST